MQRNKVPQERVLSKAEHPMRLWLTTALPFAVLLTGCVDDHFPRGEPRRESRTIELDKVEMLRVELHFGAGELRLSGGSPKLLDADFTFEAPGARPLVDYRASSFRGDLRII